MIFPKVVSDLLMFAPSFSRWPVAPVEFSRSEPAKLTKLVIDCHLEAHTGAARSDLMRGTFSVSSLVSPWW